MWIIVSWVLLHFRPIEDTVIQSICYTNDDQHVATYRCLVHLAAQKSMFEIQLQIEK